MPTPKLYVLQSADGKWFWHTNAKAASWSYGDSLDFAWVGSHPFAANRQCIAANKWCQSKRWRIRELRMVPLRKKKVKRAK